MSQKRLQTISKDPGYPCRQCITCTPGTTETQKGGECVAEASAAGNILHADDDPRAKVPLGDYAQAAVVSVVQCDGLLVFLLRNESSQYSDQVHEPDCAAHSLIHSMLYIEIPGDTESSCLAPCVRSGCQTQSSPAMGLVGVDGDADVVGQIGKGTTVYVVNDSRCHHVVCDGTQVKTPCAFHSHIVLLVSDDLPPALPP